MWKAAFTGRSESGKSERMADGRRKRSAGRSGESVVSAPAAEGVSRKERDAKERDARSQRGYKGSRSAYGDEEGSVYEPAPSSRVGMGQSALTESTLRLLDDEDAWEDESVAGRSERRSRRGGEDGVRRRKSGRWERRSMSRSRDRDRDRDRGERREERRKERLGGAGKEKERSSGSGRGKGERDAGARGMPAMGSFEQFPGQLDGGPPIEYGNGGVPSAVHNDFYMSGALPTADPAHQFPDQNPATYSRPQLGPTRGDSYGHAADYYLDQGESVSHQPGVRARTPNMLHNPDTHLVAASAEANPVQDTGNGTAADFYNGKVSPVQFTAEPDTIGPSSSSSAKPSKSGKHSSGSGSGKPSKLGRISSAAAGATAALHSGSRPTSSGAFDTDVTNTSKAAAKSKMRAQGRSVTEPSVVDTTNMYTSSVKAERTPQRGSGRNSGDFSSPAQGARANGKSRGEADSYYVAATPNQLSRPAQGSGGEGYYGPAQASKPIQGGASESYRPPANMQGQAGKSNANLAEYAATAAGAAAAGYAAYDIKNRFDENKTSRMDGQSYYAGSTQFPPPPAYASSQGGMSTGQLPPRSSYINSPGRGGGVMGPHMHHHHEHRGPISRIKDGLLNLISDPEDVARMEEYTEYIGVCKYCFDPRSSSYMAPRKHHYDPKRRTSYVRLRRKGSGESLKRVDKDSRYYAQSDSKRRRSRSWDKSDMFTAGLGAAGLAAGANALFSDRKNFDDGYSVKSGHRASSATRRRSRSSSRERRRRAEYGTIGGGSAGREPRAEYVTVRTKDGRIEKRRVVHASRSRSRDRKTGLGGVAAGAAIGAAGAAAVQSRRRESSPNGAWTRPHESRSRRSSSGSSGSRSPGLGEIFGFTERKRTGRRSMAGSRRPSDSEGGFFGGFFSPSQKQGKRRRRSRESRGKKGSAGFFAFSNGSGASSDPDMAFGGSEVFRSKESLPLRRKGSSRRVRRKSSDNRIAATVAGIGATAAALSAAQKGHRVSKRSSRPELGAKRHSRRLEAVDSATEDDWEDELPPDINDVSSGDEALAFGGSALSHRQSFESVSSGDGLSDWSWRWGGKEKKRGRGRVAAPEVPGLPPGHPDGYGEVGVVGPGLGAAGAAVGARVAMRDDTGRPLPSAGGRTPSFSSRPQQPMQYVDPRPLSDAASRISSMPRGWDDEPPVTRPGPGPIQQPKPIAPISPAFVRDPPGDSIGERPMPRRTVSSPVRSSFGLSDAAILGAGALAAGSIIAGSSSGRKAKDQVGNVRFGLTEEQQRKEDRQQRRRDSEKGDEERRRADRTRALKEEAERFAKEEDCRKREEGVRRKREEENRRAAEIRVERERIEFERREEEKVAGRRREQEEGYHREQVRFAEEAKREGERKRREEARLAEEAERVRREAEIRAEVEREQQSRRSEVGRRRSESGNRDTWPTGVDSREGSRSRRSSKSSFAWGPVAAGAAAAATVGAVVAGSEHSKHRERDSAHDREREHNQEGQALYHPVQDDHTRYTAEPIKPGESTSGSPLMDDDLFDRDFFKRKRSDSEHARHSKAAREAAEKVFMDMDDYYKQPAPSQADFFAPKEILNQPAAGKTSTPADPHGDNQVQVWHAADEDVRAHFPQGPAAGRSRHAPYGVPALNVIAPTPPSSVPPLALAKGTSPLVQVLGEGDEEGEKEGREEPEVGKRDRSRSISWGENETRSYDPPTPESFVEREVSARERDLPDVGRLDEVVVEAEDGERRAYGGEELPRQTERFPHFDVEEVLEDGEVETPSGFEGGFYESMANVAMGDFGVESPRTQGMPPVRGYVEGETDEPTPVAERPQHVPGSFEDEADGEMTPGARAAEEARERSEDGAGAEEPAWEPPLSKKEKKKREKAAKRGAIFEQAEASVPTTPADDAEEGMFSRSEPAETPRAESKDRSWEEPSDYFPSTLSKKDKKKREKALARGEPDPFAPSPVENREAEKPMEAQAGESFDAQPETKTFDVPKLSKKDQKKREKALARGEPDPFASNESETKDAGVWGEETPDEAAAPEAEDRPEVEMPKLSKKDQKKRDKALARGEPDPFARSTPDETKDADWAAESPVAESPAAEPEAEFETPELSKKEQKKREKEAKRLGFGDVAEAAMTTAGIAALAGVGTGEDELPEDDWTSTASTKKGKKGKKNGKEPERAVPDYEPPAPELPTPNVSSGPGGWGPETPGSRDATPTDAPDPFQYEVKDGQPSAASQEADPYAESSQAKRPTKKKRDSGRFNEPAASSPLRSEWNYNDYLGDQQVVGGAEGRTVGEPETYANGHGEGDRSERDADADAGEEYEGMVRDGQDYDFERGGTSSSRRTSPEEGRSRSVVSEPVESQRKASRSKARSEVRYADDPDYFDDHRSIAGSEPADVSYASERAAKRRSRRDDDDTASVTSSRSRRDKEVSPPVEKKKKGGFLGLFSRKSSDTVPLSRTSSRTEDVPLSRSSTRESRHGDEEDGERKHRRMKHRDGSAYGDDDDAGSVTSESRHRSRHSHDDHDDGESRERRRSSKREDDFDSRSEPGSRHRSRHEGDKDSRSPVSESGHRHHRRRRTDEGYDSVDKSFLGIRVEDLPPLPDSRPESPASAMATTEQDFGTPVSAGAVTGALGHGEGSASQEGAEGLKEVPLGEEESEMVEPLQLTESKAEEPRHAPNEVAEDPRTPSGHQSEMSATSPETSALPGRPMSSTAVPLRFPFGHQSKERSASFSSPAPSTPASPISVSKQKKPRPSSSEIRPLYLVERNRQTPEVEETLPSLPSSKPSSRASSVHGSDEWHLAAENLESSEPERERERSLTIDTDQANLYTPDENLLDSQETTPKASEFPQTALWTSSERQQPQFYTWADFEQDERLHGAGPEQGSGDDSLVSRGEGRGEAGGTQVPETEQVGGKAESLGEAEPSEHDGQDQAAKAIAAAAVIGGAAVLGHEMLMGERGEAETELPSSDCEPESSQTAGAANEDQEGLDQPSASNKGSLKKQKGKKGKKAAKNENLTEEKGDEVEEPSNVSGLRALPASSESGPDGDLVSADIASATSQPADSAEDTAPNEEPLSERHPSFEVSGPQEQEFAPEDSGASQEPTPGDSQAVEEPPVSTEAMEEFTPKKSRKQAKKAKKKQQASAWENEAGEEQSSPAEDQTGLFSKPPLPLTGSPSTSEQTSDEPPIGQESGAEEATRDEQAIRPLPLVDEMSTESQVDFTTQPQQDDSIDAGLSSSRKKSKKYKKKAKRQHFEDSPAEPDSMEEQGMVKEAPVSEATHDMRSTDDVPPSRGHGAEQTEPAETIAPENIPLPQEEDDLVNFRESMEPANGDTAGDIQPAGSLPENEGEQPSDEPAKESTDPDAEALEAPEAPVLDRDVDRAAPEDFSIASPFAAVAEPVDSFQLSSKKSKKTKKGKKATEALRIEGEETSEATTLAFVPESAAAQEPEASASGFFNAPTPLVEAAEPPAEDLESSWVLPSTKKSKKGKKAKMIGAFPDEESAGSSRAQTPAQEVPPEASSDGTEKEPEQDAAVTTTDVSEAPEAADPESFWGEPFSKKKGKKGKKRNRESDRENKEPAVSLNTPNDQPREGLPPVSQTEQDFIDESTPQAAEAPRTDDTTEQQSSTQVEPIEAVKGDYNENVKPVAEPQDVQEDWTPSSSSKKKSKKARKARNAAESWDKSVEDTENDARPEEAPETSGETVAEASETDAAAELFMAPEQTSAKDTIPFAETAEIIEPEPQQHDNDTVPQASDEAMDIAPLEDVELPPLEPADSHDNETDTFGQVAEQETAASAVEEESNFEGSNAREYDPLEDIELPPLEPANLGDHESSTHGQFAKDALDETPVEGGKSNEESDVPELSPLGDTELPPLEPVNVDDEDGGPHGQIAEVEPTDVHAERAVEGVENNEDNKTTKIDLDGTQAAYEHHPGSVALNENLATEPRSEGIADQSTETSTKEEGTKPPAESEPVDETPWDFQPVKKKGKKGKKARYAAFEEPAETQQKDATEAAAEEHPTETADAQSSAPDDAADWLESSFDGKKKKKKKDKKDKKGKKASEELPRDSQESPERSTAEHVPVPSETIDAESNLDPADAPGSERSLAAPSDQIRDETPAPQSEAQAKANVALDPAAETQDNDKALPDMAESESNFQPNEAPAVEESGPTSSETADVGSAGSTTRDIGAIDGTSQAEENFGGFTTNDKKKKGKKEKNAVFGPPSEPLEVAGGVRGPAVEKAKDVEQQATIEDTQDARTDELDATKVASTADPAQTDENDVPAGEAALEDASGELEPSPASRVEEAEDDEQQATIEDTQDARTDELDAISAPSTYDAVQAGDVGSSTGMPSREATSNVDAAVQSSVTDAKEADAQENSATIQVDTAPTADFEAQPDDWWQEPQSSKKTKKEKKKAKRQSDSRELPTEDPSATADAQYEESAELVDPGPEPETAEQKPQESEGPELFGVEHTWAEPVEPENFWSRPQSSKKGKKGKKSRKEAAFAGPTSNLEEQQTLFPDRAQRAQSDSGGENLEQEAATYGSADNDAKEANADDLWTEPQSGKKGKKAKPAKKQADAQSNPATPGDEGEESAHAGNAEPNQEWENIARDELDSQPIEQPVSKEPPPEDFWRETQGPKKGKKTKKVKKQDAQADQFAEPVHEGPTSWEITTSDARQAAYNATTRENEDKEPDTVATATQSAERRQPSFDTEPNHAGEDYFAVLDTKRPEEEKRRAKETDAGDTLKVPTEPFDFEAADNTEAHDTPPTGPDVDPVPGLTASTVESTQEASLDTAEMETDRASTLPRGSVDEVKADDAESAETGDADFGAFTTKKSKKDKRKAKKSRAAIPSDEQGEAILANSSAEKPEEAGDKESVALNSPRERVNVETSSEPAKINDLPTAPEEEWPTAVGKLTKKDKRKAKKAGKLTSNAFEEQPSTNDQLGGSKELPQDLSKADDPAAQPAISEQQNVPYSDNNSFDDSEQPTAEERLPELPEPETPDLDRPDSTVDREPVTSTRTDQNGVPAPQSDEENAANDVDFAATLAAGLADSGFDPDLVVNNPTFRRRASPPATAAEADPDEVFATTTTKRGDRSKTPKEPPALTEEALSDPSTAGQQEQGQGDLDDAISQSLQTAGFDPAVLSRVSPANEDSPLNEVGDEPSFSFTTSKKKKKKGNKGRSGDNASSEADVAQFAPDERIVVGRGRNEGQRSADADKTTAATDNVNADLGAGSEDAVELPAQETSAELQNESATPSADAGAHIYLAGDRDMDVDEMDKAYTAYKKREKRKKKKARAVAPDAESKLQESKLQEGAPDADVTPDRPSSEAATTSGGQNAPKAFLHVSDVSQSLPTPIGGQQEAPAAELKHEPSWSFDALQDNGKDFEAPRNGSGEQRPVRDAGYQESPSGRDSRDAPDIQSTRSRENLRSRRSADALHIATDRDNDWHMDVPKQRTSDEHARHPSGETAETPLEPTSKNRASYLFQSTPDNTKDVPDSRDAATPRGSPTASYFLKDQPSEARADPGWQLLDDQSALSPPPTGPLSPRSPLQAIPEERQGARRRDAEMESGERRNTKSAKRSETPQAVRNPKIRAALPSAQSTIVVPDDTLRSASDPLTTDQLIHRLSWPPVDEDSETVNINRSLKTKPSKRAASDQRSSSVLSGRSNISASYQLKPQDDLRPFSQTSTRSATPILRRMDRSTSGDLRAVARQSDTGSAAEARSSTQTIPPFEPPPTPPLDDEDVVDGSAARAAAMSDVFQGYGDAHGSQTSPSRPPNLRKRQSMHISELESRLDQLNAENRALQDARQGYGMNVDQNEDVSVLRETVDARDLELQQKNVEISQIRAMLQPLQEEVAHLMEVNGGLTEANRNLVDDTNGRYGTLQQEHADAHEQWQSAQRELEDLRQEHGRVTTGVQALVEREVATSLADKNAEILRLREELDVATEQIRALQVQNQSSKSSDFLKTRDEDYFDGACQKLCQHVQQWVLRFSKLSDNRICRLSSDIKDDKLEARLDNAILDGSDGDKLLSDRIRRRDVFMSMVMTMVWEYVFTRYLFGMDREQRQKLKALEKILSEVGPPRAVAQWRATTLTLLSKRPDFGKQCTLDTEAVAHEIFALLCRLLPPPSNAEQQLFASLRKVIGVAVDLSVEMRTQRAEYIMLPPLQPEYDRHGDLVRKVHFNASLMNERSGLFSSNEDLERERATVKIVLFPLVVKKGDELGEGEEEIVVCPAQVLVHNEGGKGKKVVRVMSGAMEIDDPRRSKQSLVSSHPGSVAF